MYKEMMRLFKTRNRVTSQYERARKLGIKITTADDVLLLYALDIFPFKHLRGVVDWAKLRDEMCMALGNGAACIGYGHDGEMRVVTSSIEYYKMAMMRPLIGVVKDVQQNDEGRNGGVSEAGAVLRGEQGCSGEQAAGLAE